MAEVRRHETSGCELLPSLKTDISNGFVFKLLGAHGRHRALRGLHFWLEKAAEILKRTDPNY